VTLAHARNLSGLYAITDENLISRNQFGNAIEAALQGGARIIQYRDKTNDATNRLQQASLLVSLCQKYQAISIINDDIKLAKATKAHGVHLGKSDASIQKARQILGNHAIIGVSCYNDLTLAIDAEKKTADYVAFGAAFTSSTKPNAVVAGLGIITKARQTLDIPICTIGGINHANIHQVIHAGSHMVAVISCIFSKKDIKEAAAGLNQHF